MDSSNEVKRGIAKYGFWVSILVIIVTVISLGIAVSTPPRSGPNVTSGTSITYPYTGGAEFVPRDFIWMFPAILMALLFMVLVICIHRYARPDKQIFSVISLSFAILAAAFLSVDYFIQLAVVQPSLLKGEADGISLISQYNPHGIFIALEDLGYLLMGVSFIFAAPVFFEHRKLDKAIRFLFLAAGSLAIVSLIILAIIYRSNLEYRYEVVVIVVDWLTLIIGGILLSIFFRRKDREGMII
jgi:hypothetical protein